MTGALARAWASRGAALLLALLLILALARISLLPLAGLFQADANREETLAAIARYAAIAADRPRLQQALAEAPPNPAENAARFHHASAALALADLQGRIAALAAGFGVTLTAAEPLDANPPDDADSIGLRVDLTGTMAGLQAVIHAVESGHPVIVASRIELGSAGTEGGAASDPILALRLSLTAWRSAAP